MNIFEEANKKQILICTLEKLSYMLHHDPFFLNVIDLFVFDEDCKAIIERLHTDNPAWGARQLSVQLKKRGYQVDRRKTRRHRPSKSGMVNRHYIHPH